MKQYRQGDVYIKEIKSIPNNAKEELCERRIILAEGESTGHAHSIVSAAALLYLLGDRMFIKTSGCTVEHEEHGPLDIESGSYEILKQREYHPERIRNVAD
jgi:hypothetical protein